MSSERRGAVNRSPLHSTGIDPRFRDILETTSSGYCKQHSENNAVSTRSIREPPRTPERIEEQEQSWHERLGDADERIRKQRENAISVRRVCHHLRCLVFWLFAIDCPQLAHARID